MAFVGQQNPPGLLSTAPQQTGMQSFGDALLMLGQGLLAGPSVSEVPMTGLEGMGTGMGQAQKVIAARRAQEMRERENAVQMSQFQQQMALRQSAENRAQAAAGRQAATYRRQQERDRALGEYLMGGGGQPRISGVTAEDPGTFRAIGPGGEGTRGALSEDMRQKLLLAYRIGGPEAARTALAGMTKPRAPVALAAGATLVDPNTREVIARGTPKPPKEPTFEEKKLTTSLKGLERGLSDAAKIINEGGTISNIFMSPERQRRLDSVVAGLTFDIAQAFGQGALQAPDRAVALDILSNIQNAAILTSQRLADIRRLQKMFKGRMADFTGKTPPARKPVAKYNPATGRIE